MFHAKFQYIYAYIHISMHTYNKMINGIFFLTSDYAEQVGVNKVDSCPLWNCRHVPRQRKSHQGGRYQFQHAVFGNSQHIGASFGHFQSHHTQVQYKREPSMGPQTCLTTKNLNKCSIYKLCLITVPPIDRQRAKRNRKKNYMRV